MCTRVSLILCYNNLLRHYLRMRSAGRPSISNRHWFLYAAALISRPYWPAVKHDSITPSALTKVCRATALISRVYLMWGSNNLYIGCRALNCLWAANINGSKHAWVRNQWFTSWWTPASLDPTWALASCHVQLEVASIGGVTTRLDFGRLSSMATGLSVPRRVKNNMVRVA